MEIGEAENVEALNSTDLENASDSEYEDQESSESEEEVDTELQQCLQTLAGRADDELMASNTSIQGITDGAEILKESLHKLSFTQETQCDSQAISTGESPAMNVEIIDFLKSINSRLEAFQLEPVLSGHVSPGSALNAARQVTYWSSILVSMYQPSTSSTLEPQPPSFSVQPSPAATPSIQPPQLSVQPPASMQPPPLSVQPPAFSFPPPPPFSVQPSLPAPPSIQPPPLSVQPPASMQPPSLSVQSSLPAPPSIQPPPLSVQPPAFSFPPPPPFSVQPSLPVPSSIQPPQLSVQPPASMQPPSFSVQPPASSFLPPPPFSVQPPAFSFPTPAPSMQPSFQPAIPANKTDTLAMYRQYGWKDGLTCNDWLESITIPRNVETLQHVKTIWEVGAEGCPPLRDWTAEMRNYKPKNGRSNASIFSQRKFIYKIFKEGNFDQDNIATKYNEIKPGKLYKTLNCKYK